ncbi:MAG: RDD family protein [Chloroflexia bacterium]
MDEQLTISTPEQVAFHYEMAGIGSRFMASLLDHLIIALLLFLLYCSTFSLLPVAGLGGALGSDEASAGTYLLVAVLILVTFAVIWGYFMIFEIVWHGQTPGKRSGKLRVLRRSGQPIGAGEAVIRNLVRLVDFMPGFYGIGLTFMFIDKDARRLGDMAANTIVVREGTQTRLRDVRVSQPVPSPYSYPESP